MTSAVVIAEKLIWGGWHQLPLPGRGLKDRETDKQFNGPERLHSVPFHVPSPSSPFWITTGKIRNFLTLSTFSPPTQLRLSGVTSQGPVLFTVLAEHHFQI